MKRLSIELEEKMFDRIENLYEISNKHEYRFELAMLESDLAEYTLLTGKVHQIELNLINLYVRMWRLR